MKIVYKIILMALISINVNCQTIYPLNGLKIDVNDGDYVKDVDNVLPFWNGTWKGTVNNREYTFVFTTFLHHFDDFTDYYRDELVCKFKVVDLTTNQTLYNDLNLTNFEDYKIKLISYRDNLGYVFTFNDDEAHCYNKVFFRLLKNPLNPNQVTYKDFELDPLLFEEDCSYNSQSSIPMFLPTVNLVLTRQ